MLETLTNGFEKAVASLKAKPLETPKTKAIAKARDKSIVTWRELVEAAHKDKAIPEEWILQKIGSDIGVAPNVALITFEADVQGYRRAHQAKASLSRAEERLQSYFDKWGTDDPKQFEAKRRERLEALKTEQRQIQQETQFYLRDVGVVQKAKAELRRADQCERLLPHRDEEKVNQDD